MSTADPDSASASLAVLVQQIQQRAVDVFAMDASLYPEAFVDAIIDIKELSDAITAVLQGAAHETTTEKSEARVDGARLPAGQDLPQRSNELTVSAATELRDGDLRFLRGIVKRGDQFPIPHAGLTDVIKRVLAEIHRLTSGTAPQKQEKGE